MRKIIAAIAIVGVWLSLTTAANSAELWGAYTSYDFDQFTGGSDGYGLAWNYPDAEQAMRVALEQCRKQQPPPPPVRLRDPNQPQKTITGEDVFNPPPERCGDTMIAFSTDGPSPTKETETLDPTRYIDTGSRKFAYVKYTYLTKLRCVLVIAFSAYDDGSGPLQYAIRAGDSEEEILGKIQVADPYAKVTKLACNDH